MESIQKKQNVALLLLRIGIGTLFIVFGIMKLAGGSATWEAVGGSMQLVGISAAPKFWGIVASLTELIGGISLLLGLYTRIGAILLLFTMIVAVLVKINFDGTLAGVASPLTMLIIMIFFAVGGSGRYSLDARRLG
ncbi:DoxX family protein [Chitinophaga caeni]|uniref:DoxX family protein n=1 Tax=Chitinophaga caeni TaxID=2029983 RepID=A0A291QRJ1_9BACT|nr:DoxX family protein [Chitinophaga caeni]ATL46557.1 DoxX family protein [Chitinophaga caeni]